MYNSKKIPDDIYDSTIEEMKNMRNEGVEYPVLVGNIDEMRGSVFDFKERVLNSSDAKMNFKDSSKDIGVWLSKDFSFLFPDSNADIDLAENLYFEYEKFNGEVVKENSSILVHNKTDPNGFVFLDRVGIYLQETANPTIDAEFLNVTLEWEYFEGGLDESTVPDSLYPTSEASGGLDWYAFNHAAQFYKGGKILNKDEIKRGKIIYKTSVKIRIMDAQKAEERRKSLQNEDRFGRADK